MKNRLPKVLYVSIQNTGSGHKDDDFFNATENAEDHAETGHAVRIARYELVETGCVTADPIFVPDRKERS